MQKINLKSKTLFLVIFIFGFGFFVFGGAKGASAMINYYVDPNFTGTSTGAASAPWKRLDAGNSAAAWSAINSALASDNVTIYFSARAASSDTDQTTDITVSILRTDTSTHRLTLDGMSYYNTNDTTPSWATYSGSSRYYVNKPTNYPMASTTLNSKQNYVTVRGFKLATAGNNQAFYFWGGDHFILEYCNLTSTGGSAFLFGYSAGTADPFYSNGGCDDITIRYNTVHDTRGEGIYIGGVIGDTSATGHSNVSIHNNTLYNTGIYGGEGDAIDLKDGITNASIYNNAISGVTGGTGIMSHSAASIFRNTLTDLEEMGIGLNTYYGYSIDNAEIFYNVIEPGTQGIGCGATHSGDTMTNIMVSNNTIYGGSDAGIYFSSADTLGGAGYEIKNNIIANSSIGISFYRISSGTISYNNLWNNTTDYSGLASQTGLNGNTVLNPLFVSSSDFHLQSSSPVINAGTNVGLTADLEGNSIVGNPDIGAYEYQPADTTAPTGGSFAINNGSATTNSTSVTLNITCPTDPSTPIQVAFGNTTSPNSNWTTCSTSKTHTLGTGDGTKTVYMRFKDSAGNITGNLTDTIILDTTAPTTTISAYPSASTTSTNPSFAFSSNDGGATFQCKLDSSSYATCTSPKFYTSVAVGSHTFYVKAIDSVGNQDLTPAEYTWAITTTTAPDDGDNETGTLATTYRFWSASLRGHFFTASTTERDELINNQQAVWSYEGEAWEAFSDQPASAAPVYRFWSNVYGHHFYTISETEKDEVQARYSGNGIWSYEQVGYYAYPNQVSGTMPVYRFWSPVFAGHFFTTSEVEKNDIITNKADVWTYEGVAFYVK